MILIGVYLFNFYFRSCPLLNKYFKIVFLMFTLAECTHEVLQIHEKTQNVWFCNFKILSVVQFFANNIFFGFEVSAK